MVNKTLVIARLSSIRSSATDALIAAAAGDETGLNRMVAEIERDLAWLERHFKQQHKEKL